MFSFFSQIIDAIGAAIHFLFGTIQSLYRLITIQPRFYHYVFDFFSWIPAPFSYFAVACIVVTILLFLLGRETR